MFAFGKGSLVVESNIFPEMVIDCGETKIEKNKKRIIKYFIFTSLK